MTKTDLEVLFRTNCSAAEASKSLGISDILQFKVVYFLGSELQRR